uniref:Heat shock factor binding protein 1 n=1 Tax=Angiostrongylus cantonensis TaxID=6313 RepID=A0A158P649_ANGCA
MLGFEILSQAQQQTRGQVQQSVNELRTKFDLLRMILSKMRENAEEMGITGDVQVHVIELKPFNNDKVVSRSMVRFDHPDLSESVGTLT